MADDHDLLSAWTERGDEAAFAALTARYAGLVHATCRRRLGDVEADDATQAVFLVLLRKAPGLVRRPRPLAAWLFAVAARVAANGVRGRQRRIRHEKAAAMGTPSASDPGMEWDEVRPHLDAVLDDLPARYREPLVLHYLHGLDRRATAANLGLNEEAVKKRLQRGLERARALLARRGVALGAGILGGLLATRADAAVPTAILPRLAAIPQATPSPAVAALAHGAAPMTVSAAVLIPATLSVGAVLAGVVALARPDRDQPPAPAAEVAPPGPVAAAAVPTWPATARGCWYLSLLDWRFDRDPSSPAGMEELLPKRMVEACLTRGDFLPGPDGGFTCSPVLVWREIEGVEQHNPLSTGIGTIEYSVGGLRLTQVLQPGQGFTPCTLAAHSVRLAVAEHRCEPIGYVVDLDQDFGTVLTGLGVPDLAWPLPPKTPAMGDVLALPAAGGAWTVSAPAFRQPTFSYAAEWRRHLPAFVQTETQVLSMTMRVSLDADAEGPASGRMVWDPASGLPAAAECRATLTLRLTPALQQPAPRERAVSAVQGTLSVHRRAWVLAPTGAGDWVDEVAAMATRAGRPEGTEAVPAPDWAALAQGGDPVFARLATRIITAAEHPPAVTREPGNPPTTEGARDF